MKFPNVIFSVQSMVDLAWPGIDQMIITTKHMIREGAEMKKRMLSYYFPYVIVVYDMIFIMLLM